MKPNWRNTGLYCPNCGVKELWQDMNDAGDYYCGTTQYCVNCYHSPNAEISMVNFMVNTCSPGSQAYKYTERYNNEVLNGIRAAREAESKQTSLALEVPRVFVSPVVQG